MPPEVYSIADALTLFGVVCGTGNVHGTEGPRNAVASGLVVGLWPVARREGTARATGHRCADAGPPQWRRAGGDGGPHRHGPPDRL